MQEKTEKENINLKGSIHFVLRDKNGKIKDERHIENLVVNAGKAEVAALIGGVAGGVAFGHIAIGIGTTAAAVANTALESEITTGGGERGASTNTQITTAVTGDTLNAEKTFTFTAGFAVTESGLLNAASAGDMLARQVFAAINVLSADTLTQTWKIQIA